MLRWDADTGALRIEHTNLPGGVWTAIDVNGDGNQDLFSANRVAGFEGSLDCPDLQDSCSELAVATGDPVEPFVVEALEMFLPGDLNSAGFPLNFDTRMRNWAGGDGLFYRAPLPLLAFDMTGDGRGDFLVSTLRHDGAMLGEDPRLPGESYRWNDERVWVRESLGQRSGWGGEYRTPMTWAGNAYRREDGVRYRVEDTDILVLDGDGDGALDVLQAVRRDERVDGIIPQQPLAFFHNVRAERPLLDTIVDGHGAQVRVEYGNISDRSLYTPTFDCSYPLRCATSSRRVVSSVSSDTGHWDRAMGWRTTEYRYEAGRTDLLGRGWLGFARVTATGSDGSVLETAYDNQTRDPETNSYPFARVPLFIRTWRATSPFDSHASLALAGSVVSYQREIDHPLPGVVETRLISAQQHLYESMSPAPAGTIDPFVGLSPARSVITTHEEFDAHGFPGITRVVDADATTITRTAWEHSTSPNWRIGFQDRVETESSTSDPGCARLVVVDYTNDIALGRLSSVVRNPGIADTEQSTTYLYDSFGNLESTAVVSDAGSRSSGITWAPDGYFPISTQNALGYISEMAFEPRFGGLRVAADPNGVETRRYYDGFGRSRRQETDGRGSTEQVFTRSAVDPENVALYQVESISSTGAQSRTTYDRLERPVRTERRTHSELAVGEVTWTVVEATYDDHGHIGGVTEPFFIDSAPPAPVRPVTLFSYDGLGRLRRVTSGTNVLDYWYGVRELRRSNAAGDVWVEVFDARGNRAELMPPGGADGHVLYTYCGGGELRTATTGRLGSRREVSYDLLGRRTALFDPNTGSSAFEYNAFDELSKTTDGASRVTRLEYDALGRTTHRWRDADNYVDTFEWDPLNGIGQLGRTVVQDLGSGDEVVVDQFGYDSMARMIWRTRDVSTDHFEITVEHDAHGRPERVEYDTIEALRYTYSPIDASLRTIDSLSGPHRVWELLDVDAHGLPSREALSDHVERDTTYTRHGHIESISYGEYGESAGLSPPIGYPGGLGYTYDSRGLLQTRTSSVGLETYTHDSLGQLTAVTRNGALAAEFDFSAAGTLDSMLDGHLSYGDPDEPQPDAAHHAVVGGTGFDVSYNASGEVEEAGQLHLEHTQLGLPRVAWAAPTISFARYEYDAFAQRAFAEDDLRSISYFGPIERERRGMEVIDRVTISGPTGPLYQVEKSIAGPNRRWLFPDRQGTIDASYDASTEELVHYAYDAFGGVLEGVGLEVTGNSPSESLNVGYTGHEHDGGLGIINMRGRWYHPQMRQFLEPDPLAGSTAVGLNRYAYARNSPFTFTDPGGWSPVLDVDIVFDPSAGETRVRETGEVWTTGAIICITITGEVPGEAASDSAASERAGAGASGAASTGSGGAGAMPRLPAAYELGNPTGSGFLGRPGTDGEEAAVWVGGFAAGVGGAALSVPVLSVLMSNPITGIPTGAYLAYNAFQTIRDPGAAYDSFLAPFEAASHEGAPLSTHFQAASHLGLFVGGIWVGEALGPAIAGAEPALETSVAAATRAGPNPESLFHYTDASGRAGILSSLRIWASEGTVHARHGPGTYLTDIAPEALGPAGSGRMSLGQLSRRLFGVPWNGRKLSNFVEVDVAGLPVENVGPNNFLVRGSSGLDVSGRIVRSGTTLE